MNNFNYFIQNKLNIRYQNLIILFLYLNNVSYIFNTNPTLRYQLLDNSIYGIDDRLL